MSLLGAIAAWLPHPVYLFIGGPMDGQRRAVDMIETERGMVPPERVRLREAPKFQPFGPGAMDPDVAQQIYTYRFIYRTMNTGHYEFDE